MKFTRLYLLMFLSFGVSTVVASPTKVPALSSSIMSVGLALVFIIFVILACAWVLRKMNGMQGGTNGIVSVVGSQMLGAKERLVVVKVDNKTLLLGITANSISSLCELDKGAVERIKNEPKDRVSFQEQFVKILGRSKDE